MQLNKIFHSRSKLEISSEDPNIWILHAHSDKKVHKFDLCKDRLDFTTLRKLQPLVRAGEGSIAFFGDEQGDKNQWQLIDTYPLQ